MIDRGIDPRLEIERQRQEAQARQAIERAAQTPALVAWSAYCEDRRAAWGELHHRDHVRLVAPGACRRGAARD